MRYETDITGLVNRARRGDRVAAETAAGAVHDHLQRVVQRALGRAEREVLSATALVHDAYLKLMPGQRGELSDRAHFFRLAASAMRQILVDQARRHAAEQREGRVRTEITEHLARADGRPYDLVAIDRALGRLEAHDAQLARLVEAHSFAGMTFEEIAGQLGTGDEAVRGDWEKARAFLLRDLAGDSGRS